MYRSGTVETTPNRMQAFIQGVMRLVLKNQVWQYLFVVLMICVLRFWNPAWVKSLDRMLGQSGDFLLVLGSIGLGLIAAYTYFKNHSAAGQFLNQDDASLDRAGVQEIVDLHLQLDAQFELHLKEVIGDTETAALHIMRQVRQLYDTASKLLAYLDSSSEAGGDLGVQITNSVANLTEIGAFMNRLPAKMQSDMESVKLIVEEIKDLDKLIEEVRKISMQSHLLAINTGIEATRSGSSGAAFRVIAEEMRMLASNSASVANMINAGLSRTRHVVEDGMASRITESTTQLKAAGHAAESIKGLVENFEDMEQYYKMRFAVITQLNIDLTTDIADVMGHNQNQDISRQCIERVLFSMNQRNALLESASGALPVDASKTEEIRDELLQILQSYMDEEANHVHSIAPENALTSGPKIELF